MDLLSGNLKYRLHREEAGGRRQVQDRFTFVVRASGGDGGDGGEEEEKRSSEQRFEVGVRRRRDLVTQPISLASIR